MDNIIISGVRIYFPRPGERLPVPSTDIRTFAIKSTIDTRCCLLAFQNGQWRVLSLPEYQNSGRAIMEAVKQGQIKWQ
ncbi:hypothetical protein [uncultured Cedecea sp.]|uniref:hypothetical protein n=1 Tax=uncultured Cedecea sp. TaxID=988762 RepID=UPI002601C827|nr:hypothetical protein [uncultured Cedecea sp.]